jgi:hypothetical protein
MPTPTCGKGRVSFARGFAVFLGFISIRLISNPTLAQIVSRNDFVFRYIGERKFP